MTGNLPKTHVPKKRLRIKISSSPRYKHIKCVRHPCWPFRDDIPRLEDNAFTSPVACVTAQKPTTTRDDSNILRTTPLYFPEVNIVRFFSRRLAAGSLIIHYFKLNCAPLFFGPLFYFIFSVVSSEQSRLYDPAILSARIYGRKQNGRRFSPPS